VGIGHSYRMIGVVVRLGLDDLVYSTRCGWAIRLPLGLKDPTAPATGSDQIPTLVVGPVDVDDIREAQVQREPL
jgi:hypothetical protein